MNAESAITDAQRQGLDMMTAAQERILTMNRELVDSVGAMMANLPQMPDMPQMPQMPAFEFDAGKVIDDSYNLTAEWLEAQKKFTRDLYEIWKPVEKAAEAKGSSKK